MNDALLSVEGLSLVAGRDGNAVALAEDLSFSIRRGETLCLVGESGCGKSLTGLALMRLLPPGLRITAGSVRLGGQDLLDLPEAAMRRVRGARAGMVFQEPMTSLNPVMTVGEQVAEAIRLHLDAPGDVRARVVELFDAVGLPDPASRYGAYPFELSGGMKQRVMIAMALAADPDLLIADEPTTALDVTLQAQILDLLKTLAKSRGLALLFITHDLGVVRRMADTVAVMYAGQIVEQAGAADFFAAPRHPYSQKLFAALPRADRRHQPLRSIPGQVAPPRLRGAGCRFADRCDKAEAVCRRAPVPVQSVAAGHTVRCVLSGSECRVECVAAGVASEISIPSAGPFTLSLRGVSVHFPVRGGLLRRVTGQIRAVDDVSLDVPPGTTVALVGESGCGKTTLARAVLRLLRPTRGAILANGDDIAALDEKALRPFRAQVQMIFQDPFSSLNPRMRVGAIVEEGIAALRPDLPREARRREAALALARVGLPADSAARYPHAFSGGQRQRVAIARALAVKPRLIVCDEPTSALDVSVQAQILNLLRDLQREEGISYLFISHNLDVVAHMAHRIAVMYLGRIVEQGPAEAVLASPAHPYTRMLLAAAPRIDANPGTPPSAAGEMPSAARPPSGCHFHPRCPHAVAACRDAPPPRRALPDGRQVACHLEFFPGDAGDPL